MKSFAKLKKNLKSDVSDFKKIKVALLGDTSTQFVNIALKGVGVEKQLNLDIWEADYDQINMQVFDPNSDFHEFNADFIILFQSSHKLLSKYNKLAPELTIGIADDELNNIENIIETIQEKSNAKIIVYNYNEIDDSVFGNYANKVESSFLFQLRKLNFKLMEFAQKSQSLFLCDLSSIQNSIGKNSFFQPSIYVNTEMVLSIDAVPLVAYKTLSIIKSCIGDIKKCIIIDLDNTTWGGVIGDDGLENIQIGSLGIGKVFTEFQYWVKKLKQRGIIVAVCSKNTESVAKEPFEKHPDMVLRLEDISVFKANWDNKADNIREIQSILNIGFDSMVFIDDNPFERNIVRTNLPLVETPELPEDPAEYLEFLYQLNLFETTSVSHEDKERTKLYQIEEKRNKVKKKFTDENSFLASLEMQSEVDKFNTFNTPRIAQLTQRSNQFNLRTIRYTESEILEISKDSNYHPFSFTLDDKYGKNGLISVVILKEKDDQTLFVDTWLMSCRVLKRDMENFVLNTLVEYAKNKNFKTIIGEYIETPKNALVVDHYQNLGFKKEGDNWLLSLDSYKNRKCLINISHEQN